MKKFCILLLVLLFTQASSFAVLPNIGDNSIFTCVETEDDFEPGFCYGDVSWTSNQFGEELDGNVIGLKKAKKLLKKYIKYFKKQKKIAERSDDTEAAAEWQAKIDNAKQSIEDSRTCYFNYEECENSNDDSNDDEDTGSNDGLDTPPSLIQACQIITSPTTEGPRARESNKKFIVNGLQCSDAGASPVMKILRNGSQHCTGTLILPDTVITAAHCVKNINCGSLSVENATGTQEIDVASCKGHSGYGKGSPDQKNDVALLFLDSSFTGITPVKINTLATTAEEEDLAVLAGYGIDEDDNDILKATFNYISDVQTEVISTFYTRGDENRGTTCYGDSGGPLFIYKDGEWRTQGTLSDGSAGNCALPGTSPNADESNWANLTSPSNQNFIKNNTDGVLD